MIILPKFKEIYMSSGKIATTSSVRGEYRAVLRGADGRIKYDSGWKPNTILNQGLRKVLENVSGLSHMALGDSAAVIVTTQVGLQGVELANSSRESVDTTAVGGTPNYWTSTMEDYVYASGVGTGTIREFVMYLNNDDPLTDAAIRVVLDTPIVKGAADHLTMYHKLFQYPPIVDVTGTISVTGDEDYDYVFRPFGMSNTGGISTRLDLIKGSYGPIVEYFGDPQATASSNLIDSIDDPTPDTTNGLGDIGSGDASTTIGGTYPNYYKEHTMTASVDDWNGSFSKITIELMRDSPNYFRGLNLTLDKTIGGGPFVKANTHELVIVFRVYSARYTP